MSLECGPNIFQRRNAHGVPRTPNPLLLRIHREYSQQFSLDLSPILSLSDFRYPSERPESCSRPGERKKPQVSSHSGLKARSQYCLLIRLVSGSDFLAFLPCAASDNTTPSRILHIDNSSRDFLALGKTTRILSS